MHSQISLLVNYFGAFEGGDDNDFDNKIKPLAEELFHPEVLDECLVFVEEFANGGGRLDLLGFETVSSDAIIYRGTLTFPDGRVDRFETRGTFKDGKLCRVESSEIHLSECRIQSTQRQTVSRGPTSHRSKGAPCRVQPWWQYC